MGKNATENLLNRRQFLSIILFILVFLSNSEIAAVIENTETLSNSTHKTTSVRSKKMGGNSKY